MYTLLIVLQVFLGSNSTNIQPQGDILIYEYDNDFDRVVIQLNTSNHTFVYNVYSCLNNELNGTYSIKGDKLKLKFNGDWKRATMRNLRFSNDKTQLIKKTKRNIYVYFLQKK